MVDEGLEPEEIRKAVIERLRKIEAILKRMASGEAVDLNEQQHATDRARLLLDQDVPTDPAELAVFFATAIKSLTRMIGHLSTINRETWFERLQSFLEP